jgi:4'-phosphopantetheinyl transferase
LALYALTRGRALGVDVEYVRDDLAGQEIAERFFSRQEVRALSALPADARTRAFFNCWTRKEAYIKARGEGLSLPLDQFDVSLTPGEPAALLGTRPDPQEAARWLLRELAPARGYVAALAVEGRGWRLRQWRWPD